MEIFSENQYTSKMKKNGFSLIELSIVLVILGLLVGGILAGQSLIRAAELRSVGAEFQRWTTANHAFRDKYFAIAGDMTNATAFWGSASSCPSVAGSGTQTCDGNGDGTVRNNEAYRYWGQLANAGLIEGSYTGVAGSGGSGDSIIGTNVPASKVGGAGWSVAYSANFAGDGSAYAYDYQNYYTLGSKVTNSLTWGALFKPEEVWNIDTKLDDGVPGTGKVMVYIWSPCSLATGNTNRTAGYKLSTTTNSCVIWFPRLFN